MGQMFLHSGAVDVARADLGKFDLPRATKTYGVVAHDKLVDTIENCLDKQGFNVVESRFAIQNVKREGQEIHGARMFGLMVTDINDGNSDDAISLSFAFRNSYDKSMSVGIVAGSRVFICDNLMITGEVQILRRHTRDVWKDIEPIINAVACVATKQHELDAEMKERMRSIDIDTEMGLDVIGGMAARGILPIVGGSNSSFAIALKEWNAPTHDAFANRDLWSMYNALTESSKKSNVNNVLVMNAGITSYIRDNFMPEISERETAITDEIEKARALTSGLAARNARMY